MYFLVVVILRYILVSAKHSGCCKQIPNTTTYKYKKIYSFKPCNKFYYFEFSNEYYCCYQPSGQKNMPCQKYTPTDCFFGDFAIDLIYSF